MPARMALRNNHPADGGIGMIDLTLTAGAGMRGISFEPAATVSEQGWNASWLHLYSHSGTHMDAPYHFACGDERIDQIPLDACMGSAWIADVTAVGPRGLIEVCHLGGVAERFSDGEILLLKTGWCAHIDEPAYYRDSFPRVSEGLAEWCVERKVKVLGVEPPSVADVNNLEELTRIHRILLGAKIVIVEGLANLDRLSGERVFFCALPLKIAGGDGAPCRAFASPSFPAFP